MSAALQDTDDAEARALEWFQSCGQYGRQAEKWAREDLADEFDEISPLIATDPCAYGMAVQALMKRFLSEYNPGAWRYRVQAEMAR